MARGYSDLHRRLAGLIVETARMRGLAHGAHLAAAPLAEEFGVSRTPVARALDLLEEAGAVRRDAHRGAFLVDPGAFDPQELGSEADALYWRVANDRLDGRIAESFDAAGFMARYGAARGLADRVLGRLTAEGVLRRRPGGGYVFAPLLKGRAAVAASLRFRLATEPAAFDEPGFHAPAGEVEALAGEQRRLAEEAETPGRSILNFERNARFHEAIARWSGNPFLEDAARRHAAARRLTQYRVFVKPDRLRISAAEHLAVLDSVARGERTEARARLVAHISGTPSAREVLRAEAAE